MPRVASNTKQRNKKFKGASKSKRQARPAASSAKTKGIAKQKVRVKLTKAQRIQELKLKKEREVEHLTNVNEHMDQNTKEVVTSKLKHQNQSRVVLLLPCNQTADVQSLVEILYTYLHGQEGYTVKTDNKGCLPFPNLQVQPAPKSSPIRNKLFIVGSPREPKQLIDLAKCADIVCPVLSVKSANPQKIVEDPYNYAGAFDDTGYTIINLLRSLGLPKVVGLIQHIQKIQPKQQDKVTKFYKRFLTSEFGQQKIITLQSNGDIVSLIRTLDSTGLMVQPWKKDRGYLLADSVEVDSEGKVVVSGYLKGSCVNSNQVVHVTGFDDYNIEKIEIVGGAAKKNQMDSEELVQYPTLPQDLNPFSKPEAEDQHGDILSAIQGLNIERPVEHEKQDESMNEEASDDEQDWEDMMEHRLEDKEGEKTKRVEMQMRKDDQLQFEDEVQYAAEEVLRDKYREFQGLKNFKSSAWNQLENLPTQYDRIYFFKHYHQTHQAAIRDNLARGFAYPGFYIKVTIKDLSAQKVAEHIKREPLILSFMLKHQRKMTVLHGKVQKNPFYSGEHKVESNQTVMVSLGFKRLLIQPIYSRCINGTEKTKFTKAIGEDYQNHYFCSFYHHNYFPHSPFLVFRVNPLNHNQIEAAPILRGELAKCDPMHVVLERIILTGYPFKINRRRATVRYMFFNPSDVKYFKPVEITTKMGLRGKIEESLGTHGLMKCFFNEPIKHNDTVCLHLYRRVYPFSHCF